MRPEEELIGFSSCLFGFAIMIAKKKIANIINIMIMMSLKSIYVLTYPNLLYHFRTHLTIGINFRQEI